LYQNVLFFSIASIAHGHSAQAAEQETEASKKYAETHSPKK
jgi:hypothetical protein